MTKRERWILVVAVVAVGAAATPWLFPLVWRTSIAPAETSAPARGRALAAGLGCFSCHGPGGTGGVPDPGADEPVPAFTGGVPWEYADDEIELANWILHGDPKGRGEIQKTHGKEKHPTPSPTARVSSGAHEHHPQVSPTTSAVSTSAAHEHKGLLKMPPFRDHVTAGDVHDLVAYIVALSPKAPPADEVVRRGFDAARRNGCFACHGPMGSGGIANPGSFKGYIPGFFGNDLRELAKDPAEVEAWIRDGNVTRLQRNPGAKFFLDRQPIKMPAYEKQLSSPEIADLVAMVEWIHEEGPQTVAP